VYVTSSVSPDITARATAKFPAEYNVPAVPLLALLVVKKAPAIVIDAFIVNEAAVDDIELVVVGVPNTA